MISHNNSKEIDHNEQTSNRSIKQTSSRLERFIHKTTQLPLVRKGPQFFTLHEKFEELYTESATHIDEIAERILAIGGKPVATMKEYLELLFKKQHTEKLQKGWSKQS